MTTVAPTRTAASPAAVLAVILVAAFMDLLDVTIVALAAPDIQATLGASPAQGSGWWPRTRWRWA